MSEKKKKKINIAETHQIGNNPIIEIDVVEKETDWLKIVYEEAWRQYVHEDEMAEQRDSKYLTILSIIFSAIGVILTVFFSNMNKLDLFSSESCCFILGVLILIIISMIVIILFLIHWDLVTDAGQEYTQIRFEVAKEIEQKMNLSITLAEREEWKLAELHKEKSSDGSVFEGFSSTHSIIKTLKTMATIFLLLGVICFVVVFIFLIKCVIH